ncbi:MAG: hypothetical protein OEY86_04875 [Nitrospira sp.]|nr:hypothetical protein [Nitrospira sp.]
MGIRDREYMKGFGHGDPELPPDESPTEKRLRESWEKHKKIWIGLLVLVVGSIIVAVIVEKM